MQRKEHVFQALTLELTLDLNKNCIIVICDEVSISMRKSYNDMYTNKTVIQRNKVYKPFIVYCRELAPGTVSLTGDRAQGDDSKHDSHYKVFILGQCIYIHVYIYSSHCIY